jgi:membrane protein implicated in regulation of membrane protease activity
LDWNSATVWWLAGGALVAAELATGTFNLLMLALGCAAAALFAHAGLGITVQVLAAAVVGGGATVAWHLKRSREPQPAPAESNRDVMLDIGQPVQVDKWASDGSARVNYRGASWKARHSGPGTPQPGEHIIVALTGNELRLSRR